jgi:hypothetical protein
MVTKLLIPVEQKASCPAEKVPASKTDDGQTS